MEPEEAVLLPVILTLGFFMLLYFWGYFKAKKKYKKAADDAIALSEAERDNQSKEFEKLKKSLTSKTQKAIDKLVNDQTKVIMSAINSNNFATCHKKLETLFSFLEKQGLGISSADKKETFSRLEELFKEAIRKQDAKERQRLIKEQIREEQRAEKEVQDELRRIEREEVAIKKAIADALSRNSDEHSAEVEALRAKLQEAEDRMQRATSMAQQTRSGHVYVISNIGAFGNDVFKVGMTRRLEPMDRVKELGDASVPFPFDVHMMISCDDAPALENQLHRALDDHRLNKVNRRKEFFNTDLETIVSLVEQHHGVVDYRAEPEALEYYETQGMLENSEVDDIINSALEANATT